VDPDFKDLVDLVANPEHSDFPVGLFLDTDLVALALLISPDDEVELKLGLFKIFLYEISG
jgi:hypothetical protein